MALGLGSCQCADVGKPGCEGTGRFLLASLGWWLVCLAGQMGLGRGDDSGPSNATSAFSERRGEEGAWKLHLDHYGAVAHGNEASFKVAWPDDCHQGLCNGMGLAGDEG